ncbi:MAG TPA: hypothetical protein VKU85_01995, partial [bacterium]|nr:hypothetical protein [bacterium]
PSFHIYSERESDETEVFAAELLAFHQDVFGRPGGVTGAAPIFLKIFLFDSSASFNDVRRDEAYSYLQPSRGAYYLAASTSRLLRTEYVNFVLAQRFAELPAWLRLGLQAFLSSYRREGNEILLGRLQDWRTSVYEHAEEKIPTERLLRIDHHSPEYQDRDLAQILSSQSIILTHYLIMESARGEDGVLAYLENLRVGFDEREACEAAFRMSPEDLDGLVERFVGSRTRHVFSYSATKPIPVLEQPAAPVSASEIAGELGELLAAVSRSVPADERADVVDRARTRIRTALLRSPEEPSAHRAEGLLEYFQGNAGKAKAHFRRAVDGGPDDALSHFLVAEAALRPALRRPVSLSTNVFADPPAIVLEARKHLRRAMELRPGYVDAEILHADSFLLDPGDPSEGARILSGVLPLLPARRDVPRNLLLLRLKGLDPDGVFDLLESWLPRVETEEALVSWWTRAVDHLLGAVEREYEKEHDEKARALHAKVLSRTEGHELDPELERRIRATGDLIARDRPERQDPDVLRRQAEERHRRFLVAWSLSHDHRYQEALAILERVIPEAATEEERSDMQWLDDRIRYRIARALFDTRRYDEAHAIAMRIVTNGMDDRAVLQAAALAGLCERRLQAPAAE